MCRRIIFLIFAILFLFPSVYAIEMESGKVDGVIDGDTIDILYGRKIERILLHGVDSPEKERYGRTVVWVYVADKCENEELVKTMAAVHRDRCRQLSPTNAKYSSLN